jgi:hypothetical protein
MWSLVSTVYYLLKNGCLIFRHEAAWPYITVHSPGSPDSGNRDIDLKGMVSREKEKKILSK